MPRITVDIDTFVFLLQEAGVSQVSLDDDTLLRVLQDSGASQGRAQTIVDELLADLYADIRADINRLKEEIRDEVLGGIHPVSTKKAARPKLRG